MATQIDTTDDVATARDLIAVNRYPYEGDALDTKTAIIVDCLRGLTHAVLAVEAQLEARNVGAHRSEGKG